MPTDWAASTRFIPLGTTYSRPLIVILTVFSTSTPDPFLRDEPFRRAVRLRPRRGRPSRRDEHALDHASPGPGVVLELLAEQANAARHTARRGIAERTEGDVRRAEA